jgi:arginine/ornithine N-succinyltransferase beta subunit
MTEEFITLKLHLIRYTMNITNVSYLLTSFLFFMLRSGLQTHNQTSKVRFMMFGNCSHIFIQSVVGLTTDP